MKLFPDFQEFIKLLNKNEIEYLVIGGYAVVHYGYVRATADLDIWIRNSKTNAAKMVKVIEEFGLGSLGITASDFEKRYAIIQLGVPPRRIDIVTDSDGVDFAGCYAKKEVSIVQGIKIQWIDFDSLKQNKLATGRSKDIADIDNLQ